MPKFLKVKVTRTDSSELYIEVPDDFDPKLLLLGRNRDQLGLIAMETTDRSDWDNTAWEETVEAHSVSVVDQSEAENYIIGTWQV